jgi:cobalt/nickel transport system ATP-binding protein
LGDIQGTTKQLAKWELIEGLPMTKIMASHDLEIVTALCERTIILDSGTIVADDSTSSIMSNTSLLERYGLEPTSRLTIAFD